MPIELEVEKKLKKKEDISDRDFRNLCRDYALKQVERQKRDFKGKSTIEIKKEHGVFDSEVVIHRDNMILS